MNQEIASHIFLYTETEKGYTQLAITFVLRLLEILFITLKMQKSAIFFVNV